MNLRLRQLIRYLLAPETRPQQNNRGLVLLFAFLSAFGLWMIVTLNEEYETSFRYTVRLPENVKLAPEEAPSIRIEGRGSGIDLMLAKFKLKKDTLQFDFTEEEIREGYLLVKQHEDQVKRNLNGIKIGSLKPEKLYFDYQDEFTNKVPLHFATKINLAPAYQLEAPPNLSQDSVLLRGPREVIDTIKFWKTTGSIGEEISEPSSFPVFVLDTFEGIDVFPKTVNLEVKPVKYTEIKLNIPIKVLDIPNKLDVRLSHNSIAYTCLVPLEEYNRVEELGKNLQVRVPFADLDEKSAGFIPSTVLPASLKLIRQNPVEVNFVVIYPTPVNS